MAHGFQYDAIIVGSGPNGLSAAITLAQRDLNVLVIEAEDRLGGGSRSAEITLPGFQHDVCSAIHPLAASSRFFKALKLEQFGLRWIYPPISLAHPLDNAPVVCAYRDIKQTIQNIGTDGSAYQSLMQPMLDDWQNLSEDLLGPLRIPKHPLSLIGFGLKALQSAVGLANSLFQDERPKALFAGMAGHSMLPLTSFASASFGLVLSLSAHAVGWPIAEGGSQKIINALEGCLLKSGGKIQAGWRVNSLSELPTTRVVMLDISPRQVLRLAGTQLPGLYRRQLEGYRYGPGVFKVDWALDGPVPWKDPEIQRSATVHVGGTMQGIARSEYEVWQGRHPDQPYVLVAQPSLFDAKRAPDGKHTLWAYCHVPAGSEFDMRDRIETQVERFAPGFRDRILGFHTMNAIQYEKYNPNYVGGDINSGVQDIWQFFTRPVVRWNPYSTPIPGVYICSASTPPGGGVHGMCGYFAAQSALKREFRI